MHTVHYKLLNPEKYSGEEPLRFQCLEHPCVERAIVLLSAQLDPHATFIHDASNIDTDLRATPLFRPPPQEI